MRWSLRVALPVVTAIAISIPALAVSSASHSVNRPEPAVAQPIPTVSSMQLELEPDVLSLHSRRDILAFPQLAENASRSLEIVTQNINAPLVAKPVTLRRLTGSEITRSLVATAQRLIRTEHERPIGTEFSIDEPNGRYVARLEIHYHPEGGSAKPWGYHRGISLFAVVDAD